MSCTTKKMFLCFSQFSIQLAGALDLTKKNLLLSHMLMQRGFLCHKMSTIFCLKRFRKTNFLYSSWASDCALSYIIFFQKILIEKSPSLDSLAIVLT